MRVLILSAILLVTLQQTVAFSKYGRTCKDIGCLSSEVCVMAEDPCSYYSRDNCGSYPTCKTSGASSGPSCSTFACPPTQICHLDNGTPKCVADRSSSTRVHHNENTNTGGSYPSQGGGYAGGAPGSGYPGGSPGSGYPGYSGYPQQNSHGYPNSGQGYPSQGAYPGYPNQGYPQYPQGQYPGYPNQGYNNNRQGGYGNQPAYGNTNGNRYGSSSSQSGSNPIVDKITDQLKTIGYKVNKYRKSSAHLDRRMNYSLLFSAVNFAFLLRYL